MSRLTARAVERAIAYADGIVAALGDGAISTTKGRRWSARSRRRGY